MTLTAKYIPLRSLSSAENPGDVRGYYTTDANKAGVITALQQFARVVAPGLRAPLIGTTPVVFCTQADAVTLFGNGAAAAGGILMGGATPSSLGAPTMGARNGLWAGQPTSPTVATQTILHEWGHRIDAAWQQYGGGKLSNAEGFVALWSRVVTLKAANPGVNYYGWTDQKELLAELFIWRKVSADAGVTPTERTNAIANFTHLVNGPFGVQDALYDTWAAYIDALTLPAGAK